MKILLAILCTVLSLSLFAQSNTINDPKAVPRTLNGSFTAISVTDGIDLYLSSGSTESIAVSFSEAKFEEKFKTVVDNGVLKIYYESEGMNWGTNKKRQLKAYVSFKTLEKLTASGGASVKLTSNADFNKLNMKVTSGARFEGRLKATELDIDQNSGSFVEISGSTDKLTIDISSGADFKGYELSSTYCDAKATSGGTARITIEKELNAKANSGGSVHYKGQGVVKDLDVNSGGVVKKSNSK